MPGQLVSNKGVSKYFVMEVSYLIYNEVVQVFMVYVKFKELKIIEHLYYVLCYFYLKILLNPCRVQCC